jgi:hypothetical protein
MSKFSFYLSLSLGVFLFACNPTRIVQPLQKGQIQAGANFGGPLIKLGPVPMTVPLTSVYGAYGLTDRTSTFVSLHTTSLMFGVFQTDLGITHQLIAPRKFIPGFSISPIANMMFDFWEYQFRLYPQLDINAYWPYGSKKKLIYLTMNNWFELQNTKAHDEPQTTHWLPNFGVGHQWNGSKYGVQAEFKYIAPNQSNQDIVVDYISFNGNGALGFYIGLHRKF